MNKILDNFIEEIKSDQKLQYEFKKCKTLKQRQAPSLKDDNKKSSTLNHTKYLILTPV